VSCDGFPPPTNVTATPQVTVGISFEITFYVSICDLTLGALGRGEWYL
jgi:hypothetical protein